MVAALIKQVAASSVEDMGPGTRFQPLIADSVKASHASKVVLCSGKHYYALREALDKQDANDVALIRIEELSPFPYAQLADALAQHPPSATVVWAQEEPENQGAWGFIRPRVDKLLNDRGSDPLQYAGRKACATTAVGVTTWHKQECEDIVAAALD